MLQVVHRQTRQQRQRIFAKYSPANAIHFRSHINLRLSGGERWFQMDATGIRRLPGHVAIIHRDFNDLHQAKCDINRLSMELLEAKDHERRRIARLIHDTTAQDLVASKLYLEKALNDVEQAKIFSVNGVNGIGASGALSQGDPDAELSSPCSGSW